MILDKVANLFRAQNRGITDPIDPYRIIQFPWQHLAGVTLTPDEALGLSAVWACCHVITKAISSCYFGVYADSRRRIIAEDHPVEFLLNSRPNPEMTAIAFKESVLFSALLWGGGFAEIVPDNAGRVKELWPLLPGTIFPRRGYPEFSDSTELVYEYRPQFGKGERKILPASRVFHMRGPSLSGYLGENMVARGARILANALAAERMVGSYYANGTVISGTLETPLTLDDAGFNRLKTDWKESHNGPDRAHKIAILEGGTTYKPLQVDAVKAQLIEARQFSVEEICRFFDVPPHKIQHLLRSTNNNIEHQGIEFVRDSLTPWALRFEQECDYKLFSPRNPRYTKLDTAWLSDGDSKTRAEANQILRRNGVIDADEWRDREGMPAIGGIAGTIRVIEANMATPETIDAGTNVKQAGVSGDASSVARKAIVAIVQNAVNRYNKKLENRSADLAKKCSTYQLEAKMTECKESEKVKLQNELSEPVQLIANLDHGVIHPWSVDAVLALGPEAFVDDMISKGNHA
jgi:HK97 family phage portal protein